MRTTNLNVDRSAFVLTWKGTWAEAVRVLSPTQRTRACNIGNHWLGDPFCTVLRHRAVKDIHGNSFPRMVGKIIPHGTHRRGIWSRVTVTGAPPRGNHSTSSQNIEAGPFKLVTNGRLESHQSPTPTGGLG